MPAFRIDWQRVKSLSGNPSELSLFVLPTAYRTMVMHLSERLRWEATYKINNYDFADWDELQAIVAAGETGLMANETLADVIQAINNINLVVNNDVDVSAGGGCCDPTAAWKLPEGWQDAYPQNLPEDDSTPTSEDEATLCDMAHSAHFELEVYFAQFRSAVGNQNPYQDLVEDLDNFALGAPAAGWLYSAMTTVANTVWDGFEDELAAHWASLKEDFICSMVFMFNNAKDFKAWLLSRVYQDTSWTMGFYIETLLTGTSFDTIYDGTYNPLPQFIGSECVCNLDPILDPPTGYEFIPVVFGNQLDIGANYPNLTLTSEGNQLRAVYVSVGGAGGERDIEIDEAATLINAGYDPQFTTVWGVYTNTVESFADNDLWRMIGLGGSTYNWSPRLPFAGQGKQAFVAASSIWADAEIQAMSTSVFADLGGAVQANTVNSTTMRVNANHNIPGTDLVIAAWLMVAVP